MGAVLQLMKGRVGGGVAWSCEMWSMGIAEIGDRAKEEEPGRGTGRRRWPVGAVAIGTGGRARAREGRLVLGWLYRIVS